MLAAMNSQPSRAWFSMDLLETLGYPHPLKASRWRSLLCLTLGIMGMLTPYATGPSPVYYGSGYLPAKDYWVLGGIFGVIFIAAFLLIGLPWMALIR